MSSTLHFPQEHRAPLNAYLPSLPLAPSTPQQQNPSEQPTPSPRPFVTLTFAQSLDAQISLSPLQQTALSGPSSKAMTHYLRSSHDAILVGSGTAIADDPSLNCRLDDVVDCAHGPVQTNQADRLSSQPRPVVLDRRGRWAASRQSKMLRLAQDGIGKGPWLFVSQDTLESMPSNRSSDFANVGGSIFAVRDESGKDDFPILLQALAVRGIRSVMVEGGATVINEILSNNKDCVDSLIVTIAPVLLGQGGVSVCPARDGQGAPAIRLCDVQYLFMDQDIVMCSRIRRHAP